MPATLLIKDIDNIGDGGGVWKSGNIVEVKPDDFDFGSAAANYFVFFTITDKTFEEVEFYSDPYNRLIDMNVIAGPDPQGFMRINVRNNLVNASQTLGEWTELNTSEIIAEWNSQYPITNLVTVPPITPDIWTCEGTFPLGSKLAAEFESTIINAGLADLVLRTRWTVSPAGMDNIRATPNNHQTGTAQQFSQIVGDRVQT